nr:endoglycoceramidase [Cyanea nozakii]
MAETQPLVFVLMSISAILTAGLPINDDASLLISVNPETQQLVDSLGRERFFHGTNVVVKHKPYHPSVEGYDNTSFSEVDMKILQDLGLNTIRLGMMLPGYVPTRGNYNETYLKIIQEIVSKAAKYGIYTLLDMHQDVMSAKFCVEGFPDWAVNTGNADNFPFPLEDKYPLNPQTGYPYPKDCAKHAWGDYYFTEAAAAAFQNFYNNTDGLLDAWADFWKKTAQGFKDYKSVIGYELINEPFAGDIYRDPSLMIPGVADERNLAPAYDVIHKAIRTVDEQHSIFFEGVTWDYFAAGFSKVPGGDAYRNRSVLSYHYYEPPDFNKKFQFEVRMEDLRRLKCGGFLTELLTVGDTAKDMSDMLELFDICDQHKQSWMGWLYKSYGCYKQHLGCLTDSMHDETGHLRDIVLQNTTRTYPQAVAGHTIGYKFDRITKKFDLSFVVTADCRSTESIVYFNKDLHYSNGYDVTVFPKDSVTWKQVEKKIIINHSQKLSAGTTVTFSLVAK